MKVYPIPQPIIVSKEADAFMREAIEFYLLTGRSMYDMSLEEIRFHTYYSRLHAEITQQNAQDVMSSVEQCMQRLKAIQDFNVMTSNSLQMLFMHPRVYNEIYYQYKNSAMLRYWKKDMESLNIEWSK